jgi:hypothetical protein
MGPRVMRHLPKFVQGFIDRHGKPRWYFRRPGMKRTPLPGLPWSPEFMAAYEAALAGQPLQAGSGRVKPGTMRALAVSYFGSAEFRSLKPSSQAVYRNIIDRFCIEHGDKRVALLKREHIVKLLAARAEKPWAANALRMVIRSMIKHAIENGLRADDPTRDVRAIRVKSDGHHSWTDAEISKFESCHPIGSRSRLALGSPPVYGATAVGRDPYGTAKHPERAPAYPSTKNRYRVGHPYSQGARHNHCRDAGRSLDVFDYAIRRPLLRNRL